MQCRIASPSPRADRDEIMITGAIHFSYFFFLVAPVDDSPICPVTPASTF